MHSDHFFPLPNINDDKEGLEGIFICGPEDGENEINSDKIRIKQKKIFLIKKRKITIEIKSHNKFNDDNIIKKIKGFLFKYLVIFVNKIIENYTLNKNEKYIIIKINHTDAKNLKTKRNLELLDMPLKDVLSKEKSKHYKNRTNSNKKTIERLLKNEKYNIIIQEIFTKMTFSEWLKCFRNKEIKEINGEKIQFKGADELLGEIEKKNKKEGIEYMNKVKKNFYNFENWFKERKPRNSNNDNKRHIINGKEND